MSVNLEALNVEEVNDSPPVLRFTAPNPGPKTLGGTQGYIVGESGAAYVIDPGPDIEPYQQALADFVLRTVGRPRGIVLTHGHPDHAPGAVQLAELCGAPILASPQLDLQYFRSSPAFTELHDGERLPVGADTLVVLESPGHSYDHLALWLEGARILFAGDIILGEGTSLVAPPEGNMAAYMRTLATLRDLDARLIAPGHGPLVTNPRRTIEEYIIHREQREAQIIRALESRPESVESLVLLLYPGLDPGLLTLAQGSVTAHLEKLHDEGVVTSTGDTHRLIA